LTHKHACSWKVAHGCTLGFEMCEWHALTYLYGENVMLWEMNDEWKLYEFVLWSILHTLHDAWATSCVLNFCSCLVVAHFCKQTMCVHTFCDGIKKIKTRECICVRAQMYAWMGAVFSLARQTSNNISIFKIVLFKTTVFFFRTRKSIYIFFMYSFISIIEIWMWLIVCSVNAILVFIYWMDTIPTGFFHSCVQKKHTMLKKNVIKTIEKKYKLHYKFKKRDHT
jgi:hypothetical protein